jgi:hypothetical protein
VTRDELLLLEQHDMAMAMVRLLQDPDEGDDNVSYCYLCHMWEYTANAYRVCRECGHVYHRPVQLLLAEHRAAERYDERHGTHTAVHDQADQIGACILCGSDW